MCGMKTAKAALCALILSLGLATASPPADAQTQFGLVNVAVGDITTGDILSNNRVSIGVAANVAANVCNIPVQVGVLALQLQRNSEFKCSNQQTLKFVQITR
jgi:hypothetical protein